jgi:hypothetical protein
MVDIPDITTKELSKLPREQLVTLYRQTTTLASRINPASSEYREKYFNDPLRWITDFVKIDLPKYHIDILSLIRNGETKIAIYGPHGLGKSVLAANIVLWAGATSSDCKIITTASAWRQLDKYLWPEIHKWYRRVDWAAVERAGGSKRPVLFDLKCDFSAQVEAFAVACEDPATIEGAHADRVIYIFDESKTIPSGTWEAAEGAFSTPGHHLQIALSTPGDTSGVFYSICSRQHGYEKWRVRHVSLRDAIRAGRITMGWAREKRAAWGKDSLAYQTRVWGIFATDNPESIIPLSWVELAVNRWHDIQNKNLVPDGKIVIGADTAGMGNDKTVFFYRVGNVGYQIKRQKKSRPMELAGILKNEMGPKAILNIDVSFGEGAGTANRLCEFDGYASRINAVNFSQKTEKTARDSITTFANVRALMWWNMREMLDPENKEDVALPDDELLIGDLVAVRRLPIRSDGKLQIESKEDIRKRIGRSTDDGDACCLAFYLDHVENMVGDYNIDILSSWD